MIGTGQLLQILGLREIRDATAFLENGEVAVGFDLYLPSARLLTDDDRARVATNLARVFRVALPVGGRARLYVEAIEGRLDLPTSYLQKLERSQGPVKEVNQARLDVIRMRAAEGKVRQWYYSLLVYWTPAFPKKANQSYTPEEYASVLTEVQQVRNSVQSLLEEVGVQVEPMDDGALAEMVFRYFNPSLLGQKPRARKPGEHVLEPLVLSTVHNNQEQIIRVGNTYLTHVVFHRGPRYTHPGVMDIIQSITGEFILVLEVTHPDQMGTSARINLNRTRLENMAADLGNRADPELVAKAQALARGLTRRAQTGEHIMTSAIQIILRNRELSLLHAQASEAYAKAQTLPDAVVVKTPPDAFDYWIAAAPFHTELLPRRWSFLDLNVAHLAPVRTPWRGSPNPIAYYLSKEGSPVGINPFDPRSPAWNGLVVGGTGSGKTFFTQSYITSFLLDGSFVAIIDKGGGYVPLVQLLGGSIIYFEPGASVTINPFDLPPGETEPSEQKKAFLVSLLRQMIPSSGDEAKELVFLNAAVERVYMAHRTRVPRPDGTYEEVLRTPTLSDFRRVLLTMDDAFGQKLTPEDVELIQSMAQALNLWIGNTPNGRLVDGQTTISLESPVVYFETTGISMDETLQRVGLMLLIDLIWRRVARDPAERKMLVFDEVWALLNNKHSAAFIEDLYRRLRRYNASALSISQSLSDFTSGYARGIVENATYLFLLSAPNQGKVLTEVLKLPQDLVEEYERIKPKGEILFLIRLFGRFQGEILRYEPSPYEIAAFGTQAGEQVERRDLIRELGGMDVVTRYKHMVGVLDQALPE